MVGLALYLPCEAMIEAQNVQFHDKSLNNVNACFKDYLQSRTLHVDNISKIFEVLVTIEDLTCMLEYTKIITKNDMVQKTKSSHYVVYLNKKSANAENILEPLVDEVLVIPRESFPSALKCKIKTLFLNNDDVALGTVEKVSNDCVEFSLYKSEEVEKLKNKVEYFELDCSRRYKIIFRPGRVPLRLQLQSLKLLGLNTKLCQYIFPTVNPNKVSPNLPNLKLINATIATNKEQLQAVRQIVKGPNSYAPYIIFGPPGTGKTTTIVEAILQLRLQQPESRILVTAGSNSACDTIALRIWEYFNENCNKSQSKSKPFIRYYSKVAFAQEKRKKRNIDSRLEENSNRGVDIEIINDYNIVVATLCCVGIFGLRSLSNSFTHVFIDEAGASSEPETLIGIANTKWSDSCRIILSGDHKQLGPVIKSNRAAQLGLGQSIMERLLQRECYAVDVNGNYDKTLQSRLRRNYRSHPEIVRLYNHLYYNNELIAKASLDDVNMAADWPILPNADFPIIFQAVHGKLSRSTNSYSSFNRLEVEQVKWYLWVLLRFGINGKAVRAKDIGVISPYTAQCQLILSETKDNLFNGIEVDSVEKFQGREKPIIIASFVRSNAPLCFVSNPRRLNVVLSRAKSLLILIGNPRTLSQNDDFRFLIEQCIENGTFLYKKKDKESEKIAFMRALEIATTRSTQIAALQNKQTKRKVNKKKTAGGKKNNNCLYAENFIKSMTNKQNEANVLSTEVAGVDALPKSATQSNIILEDTNNNNIVETMQAKLSLDEPSFDNCLLSQQKLQADLIKTSDDEVVKISKTELKQPTGTSDVDVLVRLRKLFIEQAVFVKTIENAIFAPNNRILLAADCGLVLNQLEMFEVCAESYKNAAHSETKISTSVDLVNTSQLLQHIIQNKLTIKDLQQSIAELQSNNFSKIAATVIRNDKQCAYTRAELMSLNQQFQESNSNENLAVATVEKLPHAPLTGLLEKAEKNKALLDILNACDQSCPIYHYCRIKLCCAEMELLTLDREFSNLL